VSVSNAAYTRYEIIRAFRNRRFFIFSVAFPLILFFVIAAPNRNEHDLGGSGIDAPLYFMVGLAAFGTMNAVLGTGARIAAERSLGWNRQLRLTPLTPQAYFRTKVLTAYLSALLTIVLLYAAGASLGVRIEAGRWIEMTLLILIGLIPFAGLGIVIGHLISIDSIGPAMGGITAVLGLLGGVWYPIGGSGAMHDIAVSLPSYWLVQASHVAIGGGAWSATGWIVVGAWSVSAALVAAWAYRRDTQRY
jgi:ABC-2 type transport system permease protein